MILTLFDIIINIRTRRQAAFTQAQRLDARTKNLQRQIFIILMSRICIFLASTLPFYIFRMITPRELALTSVTQSMIDTSAIYTWILNLNYTVSFSRLSYNLINLHL